eukprot:2930761-Lingulodinium_polyedra.AAC.1
MPALCKGRSPAQPCCFARDGAGGPAVVKQGRQQCMFCDFEYCSSLCADHDYRHVLQSLHPLPP